MYRRILATALIAIQAMTPAYAAGADARFYFRLATGTQTAPSNPGNGGGEGDEESGTDVSAPIPLLSLSSIDGNVSGSALSSRSPSSVLAGIRKNLVGGEAGVTFDSASPTVPGLAFDATKGTIAGTPTAEFAGTVAISYHDRAYRAGKIEIPVSIYPYPTLASSKETYDLPQAASAQAYDISVKPSNAGFYDGVDYVIAPQSQPLPEGLFLVGGAITGATTAAAGDYLIVVRGSSPADPAVFVDKEIVLRIIAPAPMSLDLKPDVPLVWQLDESGAVVSREGFVPAPVPGGTFTAPVQWSLSEAPDWMTIGSDGQLGGTPSGFGTFMATVNARDSAGHGASDAASVSVRKDGYVFLSPGLQHLVVRTGETFATPEQIGSNYVGSYTVGAEHLPGNVALDQTTGVSTGRFDEAGNYWWRLHPVDEQGRSDANGGLSGTNYLQIVDVLPALSIADAVSATGGVLNDPVQPLTIRWSAPENLIGNARYSILGVVPGTLYQKTYEGGNPSRPATYVQMNGGDVGKETKQLAGETATQTESRLAADRVVFDTNSLTLEGAASQSGSFDVALQVEDDHQTTGYGQNSDDVGRVSYNTATSAYAHVEVADTSSRLVIYNFGGDQNLAYRTKQTTASSTIRIAASNEAYKDGVTWSLVSGTLPPGISAEATADTASLIYKGYPTQEGSWPNVIWAATNKDGVRTVAPPISFTVGPRAQLSLAASGNGVHSVDNGQTVAATITASNMADGVLTASDWAVEGMPAGVTYATSGGVLTFSGAPTTTGSFTTTVSATDSLGGSASTTVRFDVGTAMSSFNSGGSDQQLAQFTSQPSVSTSARHLRSNLAYQGATWTLESGTIPPGLTAIVRDDGAQLYYAGYPTEQGSWPNVVWKISNGSGDSILSTPVSFTVGPRAVAILTSSVGERTNVQIGNPVAAVVTAGDIAYGTTIKPSDWSVTGALPAGVAYAVAGNAVTFSGTPTVAGTFPVVISAKDALGSTASFTLTIGVGNPVSFQYQGGGLNQTVAQYTGKITGNINARTTGNTQYVGGGNYSLHSGTLPPGVSIATAANASFMNFVGYPTQTGAYGGLVFALTDPYGIVTLTSPYTITVTERAALALSATPGTSRTIQQNVDDAGIIITAANLAEGVALTAANWSTTGLPAGLTTAVNAAGNLLISGKATTVGTYATAVTATDGRNGGATIALTIKVTNVVATFAVSNTVGGAVTSIQNVTTGTGAATMTTKAALKSNGTLVRATWTLASGYVPDGLVPTVSSDGTTLSYVGSPTTPGTYTNISWMATDATGAQVISAPVTFTVQAPFKQISSTSQTACGVTTTGAAKCWGLNTNGQMGDGTTATKFIPTDVVGLDSGVKSISAGLYHTCAVMEDTTAYCWGSQADGELGNGLTTYVVLPTPQKVTIGGGVGFKQISAANNGSCAVKTDGSTLCWGLNNYGQLGDGTTTTSANGVVPAGLGSGVRSIILTGQIGCATMENNSARCWGLNNLGQLGRGAGANGSVPTAPTGLDSGVDYVDAGVYSNTFATVCARMLDGTAKCWGKNSNGQLGDGTNVTRNVPTTVNFAANTPATGVLGIQTGIEDACLMKSDRSIWCNGVNSNGRLGTGNNTTYYYPTAVVNLGPVKSWESGADYSCAILDSGQTKCWGALVDGIPFTSTPVALN